MHGYEWPPQLAWQGRKMEPEERQHIEEIMELLQQYSRWVVLKLVEGKSPRRWVVRDANDLQELVDKLAQGEPYGVKGYREHLDDEVEWPVNYQPSESDIFGQMFGRIKVMMAGLKSQVVEVTIPSRGITLWIQQAFDQPELVHKALTEHLAEQERVRERAEQVRQNPSLAMSRSRRRTG